MSDVFRDEQGIYTRSLLGNPKFSAVDIRGFGETASQNSLFLIDGRRVNDIDISYVDLMQVPIEMIERIEIYRGPASVLYGDNAIGGVVNILLKKGEGKPSVIAGLNTGSYDLYNPYLGASGKQGAFSYNILTSSYDTTGYRHNNDLQCQGPVRFILLSNSLRLFTSTLRPGTTRTLTACPGLCPPEQLHTGIYGRKDSSTPADEGNTEDNFVDLEAVMKASETVQVSLGAAYRKRHTSFHYDMNGIPWDSMRRFETMSLTPKVTVREDIFSLKNTVVAGIDYYYSPSRSNDPGTGTDSSTNINKTEWGFYINDELFILKDLLFTAGYRLAKVKYDFDYTDNTGSLAPINDFVKERQGCLAYWAQLYHSRTKGMYSSILQRASGFLQRMNTSARLRRLRSMKTLNRIRRKRSISAYGTISRIISGASATGFSGRHTNEIYYNPLTFQNSNYGKTKRQGIETTLFWMIVPGLRLDLGYTYLDAVFDGDDLDGNRIPMVPANKFNAAISWAIDALTLTFSSQYTGSRYMTSDITNSFPKMGGFTAYDLSAVYTWKGFKVTGAVRNIFNKEYSEYGVVVNGTGTQYYYPSPERNYLLGVQYTYRF